MNNNQLKLVIAAAVSAGSLLLGVGHAVAADAPAKQSAGGYVDDASVTTRIKAKFAEDKAVSAMSISVETLQGVVQLSGFAKSADEKSRAEQLARATPGVKSVRNDVVVRPAQ